MNIKQISGLIFGLLCFLFAIAMFFFFPGAESWSVAALRPIALADGVWMNLLLIVLVVLPATCGPLALSRLTGRFERPVLTLSCLMLASLFVVAGVVGSPLLYDRVALLSLLTGQVVALGGKAKESVPFNWMAYLGFIIANLDFPDAQILAAANFLVGAYLLSAGILLLNKTWKPESKSGFRVMVG